MEHSKDDTFSAGKPGGFQDECKARGPQRVGVRRPFARLLTLRLAVGVGLAGLVSAFAYVLPIAFVFWMPESALNWFSPGPQHLIHGVGFSLLLWTVAIGIAVQAWRPEKMTAPLWVAAIYMVLSVSLDLLTGLFDPGILIFVFLIVLVFALHPRRTSKLVVTDRRALLVAVVGSLGLAAYCVSQLVLQFGASKDVHALVGHYATMALLALVVAIGGLLASTSVPGHRLTGAIAGASGIVLGAASLALPTLASSLSTAWAVASIVWGGSMVALVVQPVRRLHTASVGPKGVEGGLT